jgi:protein TonB
MKGMKGFTSAAAAAVLAGCALFPPPDTAYVRRINQIMRTPARTENETPEQQALRAAREQAFGEKIGLMSEKDAFDPPTLRRYVAPSYPPGAGKTGRKGGVNVGVIIDTTGRIKDAKIISSTDPVFEAPALAAVKQWRFIPGRKDGQLISMSFIFPVDFPPE